MATENLKVKITADASQAKAEIGKFKDSLKGAVREGESATKSIGRMTAELGTMLITLKAVKSMVNNAIDVAAIGDAIKDNAQKVFMSTTAFQEWGYVLKQNGVDISALKVGMRKFAQEVANGSESLQKYGITATDVDTAFSQAIAAIQNMSTETEKIAAATELFGARALELFPVLNLTNAETQTLMNTYRALGGTMSNELIAASDLCTDSITQMKAAWGGLRNLLAAYVIPVVTKVVQWITIAIAYIRILLAAILGVKESFGGAGNKKNSLPATTASVAKNTGGAAKNLKKASKHAKELKRTLMGIDELSKLAEKATAAAAGGSGGGGGGISGGGIDMSGFDDMAGTINDVFGADTLKKIEDFRKKVEAIKEPLNGVYLILKGLVEISLGNLSKGIDDVWEGLKKIIPGFQAIEDAWNNLKEWFKEKLEGKVSISLPSASDVKDKWNKIKDSIKNKTASVIVKMKSSSFTKGWKKIKKAWNSLKSKTVTISLKLKNVLVSAWNKVANKVNAARSKSAFAAKILPAMPVLAKGGVLTTPTTALMGEYPGARSNPEIATPQSLMYETIQKANGEMVAAQATIGRQIIAAIENKDLTVKIGDESIARSAQRGNTAYKNRTGKALITV